MIDLPNMTVLIADDMMAIRKAIKSTLLILGYGKEFLQAENGKQALEFLQKQEIDLVVLDWNMPVMTGTEVLAYIRADRNLRDLPVIMVTAEANKDIVARAGESEIDAYLLKPITVKALGDKVTAVINEANNPTPMNYHLKRAKKCEDNDDIDAAIKETVLAMEANPKSSRPVRDLGYLFFKKGEIAESEKWFLQAAEMNYLDVIALHYLGEIYLKKDDIAKAVEYLDKAMRISSLHLERCLNFGKALIKKGLVDRAAKVFKRAFEVSKNDLNLVEETADFCMAEGAKEYAASLLESLINHHPDRGDLLFKLGCLFADLGTHKKAINYLMLSEQRDKENVAVKLALARSYLEINHPIRAEITLKQALKIDPENEEAKELFKRC